MPKEISFIFSVVQVCWQWLFSALACLVTSICLCFWNVLAEFWILDWQFPSHLKMLRYYCLAYIVSEELSFGILIFFPPCMFLSFSGCFQIFFNFGFQQFGCDMHKRAICNYIAWDSLSFNRSVVYCSS